LPKWPLVEYRKKSTLNLRFPKVKSNFHNQISISFGFNIGKGDIILLVDDRERTSQFKRGLLDN